MRPVSQTELEQVAFTYSDIPAGFTENRGGVRGEGNRFAFNFGVGLVGGAGMLEVPAVTGLPLLFSVSATRGTSGQLDYVNEYVTFERRSPTWIAALEASATAHVRATEVATKLADAAHPQTSWKWENGAPGDSTQLYLDLRDDGSGRWSVTAVLPPDRTAFDLPDIPDELAKYRPEATYVSRESIVHNEWDTGESYADAVGVQAPATEHAYTWFLRDFFPNGVP